MIKKNLLLIYNPFSGRAQLKGNLCNIIDLFTVNALATSLHLPKNIMDTCDEKKAKKKST